MKGLSEETTSGVRRLYNKEKKNKIEPRDFIYIPIAYRDACFDIVKRHNPKASQKELQSEYNRCMNLAKKHHYPSKALLSLFCYGYFCPRDLNNEIKPVNITENTIENPKTKNIVFSITLDLLIKIIDDWFDCVRSEIVVPEIYAKNAGTIGKIHGAKNDPKPAKNATKIVTSLIPYFFFFELIKIIILHKVFFTYVWD